MNRSLMFLQAIFMLLVVPLLACGPAIGAQVTPTPTKTPRPIKTLEPLVTATQIVIELPTSTPVPPTPTPTPLPTDTPTPEPTPTETPTPEPTATQPPPPPPPTNTPVPPPPTSAPAPPPPTSAPAPPPSSGPTVVIDFPGGDTVGKGDKVKFTITVTDPDGVGSFTWGVFTQNKTGLFGGDKGCGNAGQCSLSDDFKAELPGQFFLGVDAVDTQGNTTQEIKQLYVG